MATLITETNLSLAWFRAIEHLIRLGGKDANLIVTIERIDEENHHFRQILDDFLRPHRRRGALSIPTVANTLFPYALYHPKPGDTAREHLYRMHQQGYPAVRRHRANLGGTYFHRLVAWPGREGEVNQLERIVQHLQRQMNMAGPKSSIYELALSDPVSDLEPQAHEVNNGLELRIFRPDIDRRIMGFPCLSHISLTLRERRLHMTALYRNQHFLRKAYGNYLGLIRLLQFLCREAGCEAGELVCIATHADAEINTFGKRSLSSLVQQCQDALESGEPVLTLVS